MQIYLKYYFRWYVYYANTQIITIFVVESEAAKHISEYDSKAFNSI